MNGFLDRALELEQQIVNDRRTIHRFGGTGFNVKESADYIKARLNKLNIPFEEIIECGIVATVGKKQGPVFLLRADYDALPMQEKSGLDFACTNGSCHACGHDFHSSMLLCAAQMLKEREDELPGIVKLMFQPAEEGGGGCQKMVDAGVLESPKVDAAMAIHVAVGTDISASTTAHYSRGPAFAGGAGVKIKVIGRGGHGAQPHTARDPISAAAHILVALEHILSFEVAQGQRVALTFGKINGGTAPNVITDEVEISGTCRTYTDEMSEFMGRRIKEIAESVAESMRVKAEVDYHVGGKPVYNDPALCDDLYGFIEEVTGKGKTLLVDYPTSFGGEDFSVITGEIPALVLKLGVGSIDEGYSHPIHHPEVKFDEKSLPYGAAIYANCAMGWLKEHSK